MRHAYSGDKGQCPVIGVTEKLVSAATAPAGISMERLPSAVVNTPPDGPMVFCSAGAVGVPTEVTSPWLLLPGILPLPGFLHPSNINNAKPNKAVTAKGRQQANRFLRFILIFLSKLMFHTRRKKRVLHQLSDVLHQLSEYTSSSYILPVPIVYSINRIILVAAF